MKRFLSVLAAGVIGLTLAGVSFDADAQKKRFGGGKNTGMQRDAAPPAKATPPAQQAAPAAGTPAAAAAPGAAGAAAKGMPGWLGPVGGLLAGGLLAAMFFGGAFENINFGDILTFLLIGLIAFFVIRMLLRRSMPQPAGAYGSQAGAGRLAHAPAEFRADQEVAAGAAPAPASRYPADFDVQGFVRNARASFIRLQAANDAKDLADIREFTTPQMYAEIALQADERGDVAQKTEVCSVNAEVLEVVHEGNKAIASVRFTGLIREDDAVNPEPFDEIWHVEKNLADRNSVWLIAGIQQIG